MSNVILPLVVPGLRDEHPDCDIRLFEEETNQPQVQELDLMFLDGRVYGDVEHTRPCCRWCAPAWVRPSCRDSPSTVPTSAPTRRCASTNAHRTHSPLAARAIEIAVEVAGRIAERL
ncbi:hypothetical protein OG933_42105 [Streptomyces sp. NBC_00016]|uniref:hypothetical protein n=1 Tax=Streptomyces sp. NBC_00016 TaxID=2975622 RepID=UPI0032521425